MKRRSKVGHSREHALEGNDASSVQFCDYVSSHIMRRTAITNLLMLGVSELTVRKISGHTDNSSSFKRYINLAQAYIDSDLDRAYKKLAEF